MRLEHLTLIAMGMVLAGGLAFAQTTRPAEQAQLDGRDDDAPEYRPAPRYAEQSYRSSMPEPLPPRDMSLPGLARQYVVDGLSVQLAQAQLLDARQRARSVLYQLYAGVEDNPRLVEARENLREARLACDEARRQALQGLRDNETYRDLVQQRAQLDDRIEALRRSPGVDAQIVALAEVKLALGQRPAEMEREALQRSDGYRQARERMLAAQQSHDRLLERLNSGVPDSPLYASALDRVNQLERRLTSQWIGFAGTRAAYEQAVMNQAILFGADVDDVYPWFEDDRVDVIYPWEPWW